MSGMYVKLYSLKLYKCTPCRIKYLSPWIKHNKTCLEWCDGKMITSHDVIEMSNLNSYNENVFRIQINIANPFVNSDNEKLNKTSTYHQMSVFPVENIHNLKWKCKKSPLYLYQKFNWGSKWLLFTQIYNSNYFVSREFNHFLLQILSNTMKFFIFRRIVVKFSHQSVPYKIL